MLEDIKEHGSINAAATALDMNYRAVWARINAAEKRLGRELLVKKTGGSSGGGSSLTPFAEALISEFADISEYIAEEADRRFSEGIKADLESET